MNVSYSLSIASVSGTEAQNVDRLISYAAEQLGLLLSETVCAEDWRAYRTNLAGSSDRISHLVQLVEVAYPAADIRVIPRAGRQA
jgi:hypothetical protein